MYTDYLTPKSVQNARKLALVELVERRRLSQSRPKMAKREDTGLRRILRHPTPDSDPVEVYSSDEEVARPPRRVVKVKTRPTKRETRTGFFLEKW